MADKEIHLRHPLQRIIPGAPVRAGLEIWKYLKIEFEKWKLNKASAVVALKSPSCSARRICWNTFCIQKAAGGSHWAWAWAMIPAEKRTWSGYPTSRYIPPFPRGIAKWKNPALNTGPVSDLMTVPLGQSSQHLHFQKTPGFNVVQPKILPLKTPGGNFVKIVLGMFTHGRSPLALSSCCF